MELAPNLRYKLINTALTGFFPTPSKQSWAPQVYKICKNCLTWSTQYCSRGMAVNLNYMFAKCRKRFGQHCPRYKAFFLLERKVNIEMFSWIRDDIRAKLSRNIQNHSNITCMFSCVVKKGHSAFYLVHRNYDKLLQLSNVVAFIHNDDYKIYSSTRYLELW